jgi:BirA family transcriptional regulator, biotin operon repressor / biotin---[acetyl-CoA-carboxylase] ligase
MRAKEDRARPAAPSGFLGEPCERHESIGSTNDEAMRRAGEGAPEGLVVRAEIQTAGRGRQGRVWHGARGLSLMFSVLLRPGLPVASFPLLALAMADAVAAAGEDMSGARLEVKWPNDVCHEGRKLCGVLAEARAVTPGAPPVLVLGAGVNVNQGHEDFPREVAGAATSLRAAAGGRPIDREALYEAILRWLTARVALAREGDPAPLLEALRGRLPAAGTPVRVVQGEREVEGTVESVSETGALTVRDRRSGRLETLVAGVQT